jgi:hypothetical protein
LLSLSSAVIDPLWLAKKKFRLWHHGYSMGWLEHWCTSSVDVLGDQLMASPSTGLACPNDVPRSWRWNKRIWTASYTDRPVSENDELHVITRVGCKKNRRRNQLHVKIFYILIQRILQYRETTREKKKKKKKKNMLACSVRMFLGELMLGWCCESATAADVPPRTFWVDEVLDGEYALDPARRDEYACIPVAWNHLKSINAQNQTSDRRICATIRRWEVDGANRLSHDRRAHYYIYVTQKETW